MSNKEYNGYKHRTGDKQVDDFIKELEAFAVAHRVLITNIDGWTRKQLIKMAKNNRKCCGSPDRVCPCERGVTEALCTNPDKTCKCGILKHPDKKSETLYEP